MRNAKTRTLTTAAGTDKSVFYRSFSFRARRRFCVASPKGVSQSGATSACTHSRSPTPTRRKATRRGPQCRARRAIASGGNSVPTCLCGKRAVLPRRHDWPKTARRTTRHALPARCRTWRCRRRECRSRENHRGGGRCRPRQRATAQSCACPVGRAARRGQPADPHSKNPGLHRGSEVDLGALAAPLPARRLSVITSGRAHRPLPTRW